MEALASSFVVAPRAASAVAARRSVCPQPIAAQPARFRSACHATAARAVVIEKKGEDLFNKTYYPKGVDMSPITRQWVVIDAKGQRLGRMSTLIANYLRGANVPSYHPACDTGAFVIVINAEEVDVTGRKRLQKTYHRTLNGRPGSHKARSIMATWAPSEQRSPSLALTPASARRWRPSSTCRRGCRSASSRRLSGASRNQRHAEEDCARAAEIQRASRRPAHLHHWCNAGE